MTFLTRFERWDPFDELTTLRNGMERLWSRLSAEDETALADWSPTSDVVETKDELVIKAELPGIEEKGFRRMERSYGTFLRAFTLPANVAPEMITASFTNGLLEVHLPKKEEAKPRSIKVEVKKQLKTAA